MPQFLKHEDSRVKSVLAPKKRRRKRRVRKVLIVKKIDTDSQVKPTPKEPDNSEQEKKVLTPKRHYKKRRKKMVLIVKKTDNSVQAKKPIPKEQDNEEQAKKVLITRKRRKKRRTKKVVTPKEPSNKGQVNEVLSPKEQDNGKAEKVLAPKEKNLDICFEEAKDYVQTNGVREAAEQIEYVYIYDGDGNTLVKKRCDRNAVFLTHIEEQRALAAKNVVFVHNHPSHQSLSKEDFTSSYENDWDTYAITNYGSIFRGKIINNKLFQKNYQHTVEYVQEKLSYLHFITDEITSDESNNNFYHAVNLILKEMGAINYEAKLSIKMPPQILDAVAAWRLDDKFKTK